MIGSSGIHHLAVLVTDLDRSERFYAGLLGLVVRTRHPEPDGSVRSVWVEIGGGAFLAIERARPGARKRAPEGPGWHMFALSIRPEDRQAWRSKLQAAGHAVVRETGYTLYVEDPDGNLVGLSHYPLPAP
ncbi:MAG: VOC family protein [Deltaproteobacteria bacterium]|nr:VOC family protein [Deltaproteobacteria bacterium]